MSNKDSDEDCRSKRWINAEKDYDEEESDECLIMKMIVIGVSDNDVDNDSNDGGGDDDCDDVIITKIIVMIW